MQVRVELKRFSDIAHLTPLAKKELLFIHHDEMEYYCAIHHDEIIGFAGAWWRGTVVQFRNAWVAPRYRMMGVYRAMWDARMSTCLAQGATRIWAHCNSSSVIMFQHAGFACKPKKQLGYFTARLEVQQ